MNKMKRLVIASAIILGLWSGQTARAESEPMLGEIVIYAFNFPPRNWAATNGQILAINQNQALFSIMGTTYGGNGQTTFALPNLRGRTPIGDGTTTLGEQTGAASVTLIQIPGNPMGTALTLETRGVETSSRLSNSTDVQTVTKTSVTGSGGSQPVSVRPPSLGLNYGIALAGIYGTRECMMGEIIMHSGSQQPSNMLPADGRLLSIAQNTALFAILGTTYGGNGMSTFALPNLSDRAPVGVGTGPGLDAVDLGESYGTAAVSLLKANLPPSWLGYDISLKGIGVGTSSRIASNLVNVVSAATPVSGSDSVSLPIRPPSLSVRYYICTQGIFPAHN